MAERALALPQGVTSDILMQRATWAKAARVRRRRKREGRETLSQRLHEDLKAFLSSPNAGRVLFHGAAISSGAAIALLAIPKRLPIDVDFNRPADETHALLWLSPWAPILFLDQVAALIPGSSGRGPIKEAIRTLYRRAWERAIGRVGARTWGLSGAESAAFVAAISTTPSVAYEGMAAVAEAIKGLGEIAPG